MELYHPAQGAFIWTTCFVTGPNHRVSALVPMSGNKREINGASRLNGFLHHVSNGENGIAANAQNVRKT